MADCNKERNWETFVTKHTHEWHGLWTRYGPDGKLAQNYQSLRSFSVVGDGKTQVRQLNRYFHADGKVEEKSWDYARDEGIFSDRSISFFESGDVVLRLVLLKDIKNAIEFIFIKDNLRVSTTLVYEFVKIAWAFLANSGPRIWSWYQKEASQVTGKAPLPLCILT